MGKFLLVVTLVIAAVIVGGAAFLVAWDIPAPVAPIEKVIPNDRFSK